MDNIYKKIIILMTMISMSGCGSSNTQNPSNDTSNTSTPYQIWTVDTAFQLLWPDHKIEIWAVPDPKVSWVTCFYSRAKMWWVAGWLWLAEDTSDASVACRQTWPIVFTQNISLQEEIRNERTSIFFKKLRIVRFYDKGTNSLIYLVYSDKLINWSPKNSISAVPLESIQPLLK